MNSIEKKSLPASSWYLELAAQEITFNRFDNAERYLLEVLKIDETNITATLQYGNLLIERRRFLEASAFLQIAYLAFPSNLNIATAYYMSLRRQGLIPECIELCLDILKKHPSDNNIKSEMAVALVMSGNIDTALKSKTNDFIPSLRWQQWKIPALLAKNKTSEALSIIEEVGPFISEVDILALLALETLSRKDHKQSVKSLYAQFSKLAPQINKPVWTNFELMRYCDIHENINVFDNKSETSLALNPVPYCPRATGTSHIHYDLQVIKEKSHYNQPIINAECLEKNINDFRILCRELIDDGCFDLFKSNMKLMKDRYAPEKDSFIQVMSTGRCGTLALYEFFKKSKRIIPYHTMQWQLIPPDRNHILYRIISGNFDKCIISKILTAYLTNRVAEICYAYQRNCTPVIINHWDTVFASFLAELFPDSKFLHIWRDDKKVFQSIYGKNQFQNEQLRHCYFDDSFSDGAFNCFFDSSLSMQQQISWYLYITREYSYAFKKTLPKNRMISLRSEEFFNCEIESFNKIKSIVPINDLDEDDFLSSFSKPVNQKTEKVQINKNNLHEKSCDIDILIKQLQQHGKFV